MPAPSAEQMQGCIRRLKSKHEHEGELASEQCLGAGLPAASWDQVCQSWGSCPATRKLEPNVWPELMLMKTVGLG